MDIEVERSFYVRMSENLAEGFRVKAAFYAPCCEGVAQGVKGHAFQRASRGDFLEFALQKPWLDLGDLVVREEKILIPPSSRFHKLSKKVGQRDRSVRALGFGLVYHNGGFAVTASEPVHRLINRNGAVRNIAPFQGAELADPHACVKREQHAHIEAPEIGSEVAFQPVLLGNSEHARLAPFVADIFNVWRSDTVKVFCVLKNGVYREQNAVDGLWAESLANKSARERGNVLGGEQADRDRREVGVLDMLFKEIFVGLRGADFDRILCKKQPISAHIFDSEIC